MPHILTELPSDQAIITLRQLIIPSSFVAKISSVTLKASQVNVSVARFHLGTGGWIIQARASIEPVENGQQPVRVLLNLMAEPGVSAGGDTADVFTLSLIPIIVLVFGVQVSTTAVIDLFAKNQGGDVSALISNIVITGIKQDEVITLAM